ncbi:DUF4247 domain-containing protein [Corynebacterium sp.]|uniref:DUF4247 domain-containing protein n=1 Tax=Corynebacterium sp. TaxID=1720 RepID=UPI0026DC6F86|nr:DUF4247 domain-containing protein [Corynebacterium sp.]MDO5076509.1 DUF4247 domain-containing protein [Corynebacterium sp.]
MNRRIWGSISVVCFLIALVLFVFAAAALDSRPLIDDKAKRCEGGPAATVQRLVNRSTPQSQATDPATNVVYLRYPREIITVTPKGNNDCTVQREDLSRYNTGHYVFLGPGFSPSAPSNSSNGSSGSSGGVK